MEETQKNNLSKLSILDKNDIKTLTNLGRALSSPERLRILRALSNRSMNLFELSQFLKMPISSVSFNVDILAEANLITVDYRPSLKGHMKLCSLAKTNINLILEAENNKQIEDLKCEMPVGCYTEANVQGSYLVDDRGFVFRQTDPQELVFDPRRFGGQLFSFNSGYVVYDFPNIVKQFPGKKIKLDFSLELCSEAPYYYNDWPSDITIWINDIEIATYTSPGDFGGKRGTYTPSFWKINSTQYGLLKHFSVDEKGCYIDDVRVNNLVTIKDLNISESKTIKLKIGIKDGATHSGGVNIFGKRFGNFNQDIVLTISEDLNYDL